MFERFRRLPSPALVISAVALVVAVGGGSYALATSDSHKDRTIAKRVANEQINRAQAGPLASGQTLRGTFGTAGQKTTGFVDEAAITFQVPLKSSPTFHDLPPGTSSGKCPGSVAKPSAKPGNLCLYEAFRTGTTGLRNRGVFRFGTVIYPSGVSDNTGYEADGVWAVTAR
jgi:hypothetical protein